MNNDDKFASLSEIIAYLFGRPWDADTDDGEDERLQRLYDETVERYGWKEAFEHIDRYMRTKCLDGQSACNFAHLFWIYNCSEFRRIPEPFRFLGYLYYKVGLQPWKYGCAELFEGLVFRLLSGNDDYGHNPFMNYDYSPEKAPDILAEAEKLKREDAGYRF